MLKHPEEIPITYLNKGQTYRISVLGPQPPPSPAGTPRQYRTSVRVVFEDNEQRVKPAACWQLWRDGRGSNEAHQRNGRLLAVEYVDPAQSPAAAAAAAAGASGAGAVDAVAAAAAGNGGMRLDSERLDGFSLIWTAAPGTPEAGVLITLRFNFLSTDFSHSKGVKGIPLRLCTKTELLPTNGTAIKPELDPAASPDPADSTGASPEPAELVHCKIKLFRDHGAERKLSNDIMHVNKLIDKAQQQLAQAELSNPSISAGDKRRRASTTTISSVSSSRSTPAAAGAGSASGSGGESDRPAARAARDRREADLRARLRRLRGMFASPREVSVLDLACDEVVDDPDRCPLYRAPGMGMEGLKVC